MRLLLVKTSSLGDLIHTLPALTDAAGAIPGLAVDWVVEEAFAELAAWHPAVQRVIPVALRRWRKQVWRSLVSGEPRSFLRNLREQRYDCIIDAQGLMFKSALLALLARGPRVGFDRHSAREAWVAGTYQRSVRVPRTEHAIDRLRQLFAAALRYSIPQRALDYGIEQRFPRSARGAEKRLIFLHGTTWPTKHWPESCWRDLAGIAVRHGYAVDLPWGSGEEQARARRIASVAPAVRLLPSLGLSELAYELAAATGVVGVDTGLCHLAAALAVPSVTLYGPTRHELTGTRGQRQLQLSAEFPCAPCLQRRCGFTGRSSVYPACFSTLPAARVWSHLQPLLEEAGR